MKVQRTFGGLWCAWLAASGCGGDGATTVVDTVDVRDVAAEVDMGDTDVPEVAPDGGGEVVRVRIDGPRVLVPGRAAPLVFSTHRWWSGEIEVRIGSRTEAVAMRHGRGSLSVNLDVGAAVTFSTPGVVPDQIPENGATLELQVAPVGANDLVVDGELVVPAGETLTLRAGQRVVLGPLARIVVQGTLKAEGTEGAPILFTSKDVEAFGTIEIRGGRAELDHTWLSNGGGRARRFGGHSDSDPVIAVVDGTLVMRGGGLVDNPGKAFWAERADVELFDVTIARCDTGGEYVTSVLVMEDCHTSEIPDGDGRPDDDDNDAIYLRKAPLDAEGNPRPSRIAHSVFAFGEDDGIDHNGGTVVLDDVIVTDFRNEGLAASDGGAVEVRGSVFAGNTQGIESGYGSPVLTVRQTLLTRNDVGLRWGDSYEWEALGTIDFADGIIVGNGRDIDIVDPQQGEAPEADVRIACSAVGDEAWANRDGNVLAAADADAWCPMLPEPGTMCAMPMGPEVCR